jgi:2-keto-4-pentenoate hydratase/2-oxohepta-3-ene-1,7-dioic acid hydratase in catechol pathway
MIQRFYRVAEDGPPRYVVERDGEWRRVEGNIFDSYELGDRRQRAPQRFLAPVEPSKIVCVGLNYKDHAAEQNKPLPAEPMIFIKPSTSVIGPGEPIVIPEGIGRVDHEAEVAVVIGWRASSVAEEEAHKYVFGVTCVNDVTARGLQEKNVGYTRAKGFDSFAPVGPCLAHGLDFSNGLTVEGSVNGARRQSSSTRQLIFPIGKLIAFISSIMTLLPGDIISTGTPSGVGPLQPGDQVTVRVEGVGELTNPVALAVRMRKP